MRFFKILFCALMLSAGNSYAEQKIQLGLDQPDVYGPLLKGKRVGLMVNQSSIDSQGQHAIEKLRALEKEYGFTVTTLFSVEHGLRGKEDAGFGDDDHLDKQTGLPIVSLYGRDKDNRSRAHPTAEQLENVDVVIYDLQDVGVRYFTYTVSMHHMMESLQQEKKALMVLDRPNPLGGAVYGPLLDEKYISGIGIHPIPMVHGLTSGEFARMIVGEGWLTHFDDTGWSGHGDKRWQMPGSDLYVVKMGNYTHQTPYSLPVYPSPNLRSDLAIALYPSLGVFEATSVNSGRGSEHPFEQLGFPDKHFYVDTCYTVDPNQAKAGWPQAGKEVCGERLTRDSIPGLKPSIALFVDWWYQMVNAGYAPVLAEDKEAQYLKHQDEAFLIRPTWLAKVTGDRSLETILLEATKQNLSKEQAIKQVEANWAQQSEAYRKMRENYLLYP